MLVALLLSCTEPPKDEECSITHAAWIDADGDGFGGERADPCDEGVVFEGGDCDDEDAAVHPGAAETCDGLDNDCDGHGDPPSLLVTAYADADGDGYGDPTVSATVCAPEDGESLDGWVTDHCDCDDSSAEASLDLLDCPAASCPLEGSAWLLSSTCEAPVELELDATLTLSEDGVLTLCSGSHTLQLTVDTSTVVVWGEGAESTSWSGSPGLQVTAPGARVAIRELTLGGASVTSGSSTAAGTGMLVSAGAGDVDLSFEGAILGRSSGERLSAKMIVVDGDLRMSDSAIDGVTVNTSSSYSNTCAYTGVSVSGDLELFRTTVSEINFYCASGSHSGAATGTYYGILVGGDAYLDQVEMTDSSLSTASSGTYASTDGALLWVGGDIAATDLVVRDNTFAASMYCASGSCYRALEGGVVRAHGTVDWVGGALMDNEVGLSGYDYGYEDPWTDTAYGAPLYWSGDAEDTTRFEGVDFGEANSPDIGFDVVYDAEGVEDLLCDVSGCG